MTSKKRLVIIKINFTPSISNNIYDEFNIRNTQIKINTNTNKNSYIELYGYDNELKYTKKNISSNTKLINILINILKLIDTMPMGKLEHQLRKKRTRKYLLKKCGLPDIPETQHCFSDTTHHTCCMLGNNTRKYADSTGNSIGSLSVKVQKNTKHNEKHNKKLYPWCSCTGSKVCSYYTNRFGSKDGTHIKFKHIL